MPETTTAPSTENVEHRPDERSIQTSKQEGSSLSTPPSVQEIPCRIHLELSDLSIVETLQTRETINAEKVAEYADALRDGTSFPPIVVFRDGDRHWVADGFHRIEATKLAGRTVIDAEVRTGTHSQALHYALSANARHGLPRTTADKQRAVKMALRAYPDAGARLIAELCAVSHNTVRAIQKQVVNLTTCEKRVGRDGKVYPAKKSRKKSEVAILTAPSVPDAETDSTKPVEDGYGDGATVGPMGAKGCEQEDKAPKAAPSIEPGEEDDAESEVPSGQTVVHSRLVEYAVDQAVGAVSIPPAPTEEQVEGAGVAEAKQTMEEPVIRLLDETPFFESEWPVGMVELRDICNFIPARRSRNASARPHLQWSTSTLLLTEHLTFALGRSMNTVVPRRLNSEEANAIHEVLTFLGSRVGLAKEEPAAFRSPQAPETEEV